MKYHRGFAAGAVSVKVPQLAPLIRQGKSGQLVANLGAGWKTLIRYRTDAQPRRHRTGKAELVPLAPVSFLIIFHLRSS